MLTYILNMATSFALFFYGITSINKILCNVNKERIKKMIINKKSNILSIIKGIIVTIIVQSSSFVTVLLTNLVDTSIISLKDASNIIMGSNIGTCFTGFFIALFLNNNLDFNINTIIGIFSIISFIYNYLHHKNKANFIMGIIIILLSINLMSSSSSLLDAKHLDFIFRHIDNPFIGIIIGILLTFIFQSSSLITGLLCSMSITFNISYLGAINLILGSNIGTCSTALISSITLSKNAQKVGIYHLCFNIIGSLIFLSGILIINYIYGTNFIYRYVNTYDIALINISFNVLTTILIFPFNNKMLKLCHFLVK